MTQLLRLSPGSPSSRVTASAAGLRNASPCVTGLSRIAVAEEKVLFTRPLTRKGAGSVSHLDLYRADKEKKSFL